MSTFRTTSTRVIAANVNNTQHPESAVHSGGPKILKLCIQNTPKEKRRSLLKDSDLHTLSKNHLDLKAERKVEFSTQ